MTNPINDNGAVDYNKIINEPTPHEAQNTLNKNDKLNWTDEKVSLLRYVKITNKNNGDVYYSELSPGNEKPKDNENLTFEYAGRTDALIGMYEAKYGKEAMLKYLDEYLYKLKAERREHAIKNLELEVIRPSKQMEAMLLRKDGKIKLN